MKIAKLTFLYVVGGILTLFIFITVGYVILSDNHSDDNQTKRQEIEVKHEDGVQIERYSPLEETATCEHYTIREYEGKLAIYVLKNQSNSVNLLKITDIEVESIDQSVSEQHLESLTFDSIESLENYLEGIVS